MSFAQVREAIPADAANVIALFEDLYQETKFLLYERGESTSFHMAKLLEPGAPIVA